MRFDTLFSLPMLASAINIEAAWMLSTPSTEGYNCRYAIDRVQGTTNEQTQETYTEYILKHEDMKLAVKQMFSDKDSTA